MQCVLQVNMPLSFIKSQKGNPQLIHNGFRHTCNHKDLILSDKVIWRCQKYSQTGCRGRCHTDGITETANVIFESLTHNHIPNAQDIAAKRIVNEVRDRARHEMSTPHLIVAEASIGIKASVSGALPPVNYLKKLVQRNRKAAQCPLPVPDNLRNLEIPPAYKTTATGAEFLLFDSGPEDKRILIFSTARNLDLMSRCNHWYMDGTFKTTPLLFAQLYTIHGVKYNSVIPNI